MTVGALCATMDSREFSEWKAFNRYFEPFGDEWRQTALTILACLAPYMKRQSNTKVTDFMPVAEIPQTPDEVAAQISKMIAMLPPEPEEPCPPSPDGPATPST